MTYVEKITQELKLEIERDGLKADIPNFPEPPMNFSMGQLWNGTAANTLLGENGPEHLRQSVMHTQLLKSQQVLFYRSLTSYYKCVEWIVIFCKRVIRKLARFLMEPMVEEINKNRMAAAAALDELQQYVSEQADCESMIPRLLAEMESVRRENRALRRRVDMLENAVKKEDTTQ